MAIDIKSYDKGWNDALDHTIETLRNLPECVLGDEDFGIIKEKLLKEFRNG